jgi:hypothetical protein
MNVGLGAAIGIRWAGMDIREHKSFAGIGGTGLLPAGQQTAYLPIGSVSPTSHRDDGDPTGCSGGTRVTWASVLTPEEVAEPLA